MGQEGAADSLSAHLDLQRCVLGMDQLSMNANGILLRALPPNWKLIIIISFVQVALAH